MSIRNTSTTTPTPVASTDRLHRVLEAGLRLAPQAEKVVPTAVKANRLTGEVTLTKEEWEKLKKTIEKKEGRLPSTLVPVVSDDDSDNESRPRMPSALELLQMPAFPAAVPAAPPSEAGQAASSAPTWYKWDPITARTNAMRTLSWHFWLKGDKFNRDVLDNYIRTGFRVRMQAIMPSMFTSVPGVTQYVLAPGNLKIPTNGFDQLSLIDTIAASGLTIRVTERDGLADDTDDEELTYTLLQFHLRIEEWLGDELLRVGLLGSHEIRSRGDAFNTISARMGQAFDIRYPYVPLDGHYARWQDDTVFYRPFTPQMSRTDYENSWGVNQFTNERRLAGQRLYNWQSEPLYRNIRPEDYEMEAPEPQYRNMVPDDEPPNFVNMIPNDDEEEPQYRSLGADEEDQ